MVKHIILWTLKEMSDSEKRIENQKQLELLKCKARIIIFFNINCFAVIESKFLQKILHDNIVAMGVYAKIAAFFKCPANAEGPYALF